MNLLTIEDLVISYRNNPPAVNDLSFSISEGKIICIVGESGSGKSTLIHSFLGLLPAGGRIVSGSILYKDQQLMNYTDSLRRQISGNEISIVFQDAGSHFDPIKKIERQFSEMLRCHLDISRSQCLLREREMLERLNLMDTDRILDSYPFELSGGMKQRVALAMAMALGPRLLLADEPTSALDVTIQAQVVQQMLDLCRYYNTAIILVSHNLGIASFIADEIGVMKDGKIIEWGSRDDIIRNPRHPYTRELLESIPGLEDERFVR